MPLTKKHLTAAIGVPVFAALLEYGPAWAFDLVVLVFALMSLAEVYRLARESGHQPSAVVGFPLTAGFFALYFLVPPSRMGVSAVALVGLALLAVGATSFRRERAQERLLGDMGATTLGILFMGLLLGHFVLLRGMRADGDQELGRDLTFFLFAVVWLADAGAYHVGSAIGRHKLAPWVSPKKSVEGMVGGLVLGVAAGLGFRWWLDMPYLGWGETAVLAFLLALLGLLGDLIESALKRGAGVKDSGVLLPGHGGMLDRADSLLFTTPFLVHYMLLGHGPI